MKKLVPIVFILACAPAPLAAQNAPQNGVLVIYGNDKCPTNADGQEIVVCVRRPAEEKYRIPKELRDQPLPPQKGSWSGQAQGVLSAGASGIGSCSAVGAGGYAGCSAQFYQQGRQEAKENKQAEQVLP